jgi:excisionase family DNA binding protein
MQHKKFLVIIAFYWYIFLTYYPNGSRLIMFCHDAVEGEQPCRRCDMSNEEVLKLKDIAVLLKVGPKTIYTMAQSGELPAFKVRGQWRFFRKDIDVWIEHQKNTNKDFGTKDQK